MQPAAVQAVQEPKSEHGSHLVAPMYSLAAQVNTVHAVTVQAVHVPPTVLSKSEQSLQVTGVVVESKTVFTGQVAAVHAVASHVVQVPSPTDTGY